MLLHKSIPQLEHISWMLNFHKDGILHIAHSLLSILLHSISDYLQMYCGSCPCPRNARATGDLGPAPLPRSIGSVAIGNERCQRNGTSRKLTVPGEGFSLLKTLR